MPPRQLRERISTWTTPRRPKVDQDYLAMQVAQLNRLLLDPLFCIKFRQRRLRNETIVEKLVHVQIGINSEQPCRRIAVKIRRRQLNREASQVDERRNGFVFLICFEIRVGEKHGRL